MSTLHLFRHGQIKANRQGRWNGSTDAPLTWAGRRQAKRTGRYVAKLDLSFAAAYCSPLERCRHTAEHIVKPLGLTVEINEDLREYAIGEWEDEFFRVLHHDYGFIHKATSDHNFKPPGGESLAGVSQRMCAALASIAGQHAWDEHVIVVSHGACMAVALAKLLNDDPGKWMDYHFANCSHTRLVLAEQTYIDDFNNTAHL